MEVSQALLDRIVRRTVDGREGERAAELKDIGGQGATEVMSGLVLWLIFHLVLEGKSISHQTMRT